MWPLYQQEHYWEFVRNAQSQALPQICWICILTIAMRDSFTPCSLRSTDLGLFFSSFPVHQGHLGKFLKMQMPGPHHYRFWAIGIESRHHFFLKASQWLWWIARCDPKYDGGWLALELERIKFEANAFPLTSFVILGKLLSFSDLQFLHSNQEEQSSCLPLPLVRMKLTLIMYKSLATRYC